MCTKHESQYTNKIKTAINKIGKQYRAIYMDGIWGENGIPDLLILNTFTNEYIHVEIKKENEKLRPSQEAWIKAHASRVLIVRVWSRNDYSVETYWSSREVFDSLDFQQLIQNILP